MLREKETGRRLAADGLDERQKTTVGATERESRGVVRTTEPEAEKERDGGREMETQMSYEAVTGADMKGWREDQRDNSVSTSIHSYF